MLHPDQTSAARRISDLRREQPGDPTLQNLLALLSAKLELCARLPILEYEAKSQGHETSARALRRLAEVERESFNEMLVCLRRHLDETSGAGTCVAAKGE